MNKEELLTKIEVSRELIKEGFYNDLKVTYENNFEGFLSYDNNNDKYTFIHDTNDNRHKLYDYAENSRYKFNQPGDAAEYILNELKATNIINLSNIKNNILETHNIKLELVNLLENMKNEISLDKDIFIKVNNPHDVDILISYTKDETFEMVSYERSYMKNIEDVLKEISKHEIMAIYTRPELEERNNIKNRIEEDYTLEVEELTEIKIILSDIEKVAEMRASNYSEAYNEFEEGLYEEELIYETGDIDSDNNVELSEEHLESQELNINLKGINDGNRYPDDLNNFTYDLMEGIVGEKNMIFESDPLDEMAKTRVNVIEKFKDNNCEQNILDKTTSKVPNIQFGVGDIDENVIISIKNINNNDIVRANIKLFDEHTIVENESLKFSNVSTNCNFRLEFSENYLSHQSSSVFYISEETALSIKKYLLDMERINKFDLCKEDNFKLESEFATPFSKDKIIGLYKEEYPAIKHISENTAKCINDMNIKNGSVLSIKDIFSTYREIGKMLEDSEYLKATNIVDTPYERLKQLQGNESYRQYLRIIAEKHGIENINTDVYKNKADLIQYKLSDKEINTELNKLINKYENELRGLVKASTDIKLAETAGGYKPLNVLIARLKNFNFITYSRNDIEALINFHKIDLKEVKETMKEIDTVNKQIKDKNYPDPENQETYLKTENVIKKDFKELHKVVEDLKYAQLSNKQEMAQQKVIEANISKTTAFELVQ